MFRAEESAWHDLQVSLDERHLQLEGSKNGIQVTAALVLANKHLC